jgi:thiamine monophosphate synthase
LNSSRKKIVGIGGVTPKNIKEITELGFTGVGFKEGIWNSLNTVNDFKQMKDSFF